MSKRWSIDDIDWSRFDRSKVSSRLLDIVRAAAMVEYRSGDYVTYLCNVFTDDEEFKAAARVWGEEEIQHGLALAQWARMADPTFDFEASYREFTEGFHLELERNESIRGSRTGELLARCMVEIGTSSFYSAIRDASEEPVLREICTQIARDEFAHYGLFRRHMERYQAREGKGMGYRLRTALMRAIETQDDELSYAFHAGNSLPGPYDRKLANSAYAARALPLYQPGHVERGIFMALKALGFEREWSWQRGLATLVYRLLRVRARMADDSTPPVTQRHAA